MNTLNAGIKIAQTLFNGQTTVAIAGTAQALAESQPLMNGVLVKALDDNTNLVYVGNASVDSTNGYILLADASVFVEIDDLIKLFIDVDTAGEGVSWLAQ